MRRVYGSCALPLRRSVSATTRPPRPDEINGRDYYFLSEEEFQLRRQRGEFLESCQVYNQNFWYGTLWSEVAPSLEAGNWVILEIDVQGAQEVAKQFPDALTIFIRPSSLAELRRRLLARGTEPDEAIEGRLAQAQKESALAEQYQYQVVNDDLEQAVQEICSILSTEWEKWKKR